MSPKRLSLDIETNGFLREVTTIWCVVTEDIDTGEVKTFLSKEGLQGHLDNYDEVWMHNGIAYDSPVLSKLWDIKIPRHKLWDTLLISRMFLPDLEGGHSLANWGSILGFPKIDFKDFDAFSDDMVIYCKRDVKITTELVRYLEGKVKDFLRPIKIDRDFAYYISLQESSGFYLDLEFTNKYIKRLEKERTELVKEIQQIIPPVQIRTITYKDALKEGRILEENEEEFTYITAKTQQVKTTQFKLQPFNPNSRQQIADYLKKTYQWNPTEFTEKGAPDLSEKVLRTLPYSEADILVRIVRLTKQLGMIREGNNSWLNFIDKDNRVRGRVLVNGAVGGRCTHSKPNLAQCDGEVDMRTCWSVPEGKTLVGCDASGLELRMLAHYLSMWDGGNYVELILRHDRDPKAPDIHVYNQELAAFENRSKAKVMMYALIYGAGNKKLGQITALDQEIHTTDESVLNRLGREVREKIKDNLIGYRELMELLSERIQEKGYLLGIDGRPLIPRNDYSSLNLLLQSGGASVMKQALNNFMQEMAEYKYGEDYMLCANVHDEVQIETRPELAKLVGETFKKSIEKVTEDFNMRCPLTGEYKIGRNWSETH